MSLLIRHQFLCMSLDFKNKFSFCIALNSKPKIQKSSKRTDICKFFYRKGFLKFTSQIYKGNIRVLCFVYLFIQSFNLVFKMFTPRFPLKIEKNEIGIALKNIRRSTA